MLLSAGGVVLLVVALLLMVPVTVLLLQVLAAVLPASTPRDSDHKLDAPRPRTAVLVPAHDEAAGIAATLQSVLDQIAPGDRLIVVADNCSDDTARVASAAGAEVIERNDLQRRGKGYALDRGIRFLEGAPPEVVLVVDADCKLHSGSLDHLARRCAQSMRPVQALDLMHAPEDAGLKTRIAAFAWVVKNHARALGGHRLGLPCQLMGTGMAFPWELIRAAPLASGHLVEDMRLGLDMAMVGAAPLFCPQALVTSMFPSSAQGIAEQRVRWERGHLGAILLEAPSALWRSVASGNPRLAAMVLDLSVPPLTVLVMLLVLQTLADSALAAFGGSRLPVWIAAAALSMVGLTITLAWWRFGRGIVSIGDLVRVPLYVLAKVPLYARMFHRGNQEWVRTTRDNGQDSRK